MLLLWKVVSRDQFLTAKTIVAVSGSAEDAAIFLRLFCGKRVIFVGVPVHYSPACFDLIFKTTEPLMAPNVVGLPSVPSQVLPQDMANTTGSSGAILVGGDCRGVSYSAAETGDSIGSLLRGYDGDLEWNIVTSPRTGKALESAIAAAVGRRRKNVNLMLWADGDRADIRKILSEAKLLVVGMESLSLISDGLATRKPIFLLKPKDIDLAEVDPRIVNIAEKLLSAGVAMYLPVDRLGDELGNLGRSMETQAASYPHWSDVVLQALIENKFV